MKAGIEIFLKNDGFYVGYVTKSGRLNRNARKITNEEVVNMFAAFFRNYCEQNEKDYIVVDGNNDFKFYAKRLPTELGE